MTSHVQLPELSHLQIAVLGRLVAEPHKGAAVRAHLRALGAGQTGPAFYQMMSRLEAAGLAEGWYEQKVVAGQIIKERHYRVTPAGRKAWREARDFYRQLLATATPAVARG